MQVIKLEIFQERAHFRNPKIISSNLVPSLPLPPPTTIAGMLTVIYGERFAEKLDFAIVGEYDSVYYDYQRTDSTSGYLKWKKSLKLKILLSISEENYSILLKYIFNFETIKDIPEGIPELKSFYKIIDKISDDEIKLILQTELHENFNHKNFKKKTDFIEYYDSLNSEEDNEIKSTIENLYELDEREYNRLVKFLQEREKIIKEIRRFENQEDYSAFKKRNKIQGVSTFEILYKKPVYQGTKKKPNLTIFIKTENKDTLTTLNYRLNDILVYSVLGRKEDYVEILSSEIVEVKKIKINSIKDAVIKRLKLQNCYIRLDLSSITKEVQELSEEDIVEQRFQNEISDMGNLYTMPRIYKDIKANKAERKYLHSHYIHIKESSRYIAGEFYIYQNQIFKWLVN